MDGLRETLVYKDVPVHICMKQLSRLEQYECIRMILANQHANVTVCKHGSTNSYIDEILEALKLKIRHC
jgi:hypothetical protein